MQNSTQINATSPEVATNADGSTPAQTPAPAAASPATKAQTMLALTPSGESDNVAALVVAEDAVNPDRSKLSADEESALKTHEEVISRNLKSYVEVGEALAAINKKRLYRSEHATFEAYCIEKWKFKRAHAYRLMAASKEAKKVSQKRDTKAPACASHAALYADVPEDQKKAVTDKAAELAGDGKTTAGHIKAAKAAVMQPTATPEPTAPPLVPQAGSRVVGMTTTKARSITGILDMLRRGREHAIQTNRLDVAINLLNCLETELAALAAPATPGEPAPESAYAAIDIGIAA